MIQFFVTNDATLFLQLSTESTRLLDGTLSDLSITINYDPESGPPITRITEYIEEMRILLWDTAFFREFKEPKGVHKNNAPSRQFGFAEALRRTLYRYFKFVLLPAKVVTRSPPIFAGYLDPNSENCMISDAIKKSWGPPHWERCGWYLDCPIRWPPTFDIALRDSIQPDLIGSETLAPPSAPVSESKGKGKAVANQASLLTPMRMKSLTCFPLSLFHHTLRMFSG